MTRQRLVAALELVLLLPGMLFMASLFLRSAFPPAERAQQLVLWYSGRVWTLWVLLLALPFAALVTGCATLLGDESFRVIRAHLAMLLVAAMTLAAAAILAIVVLHMAAN